MKQFNNSAFKELLYIFFPIDVSFTILKKRLYMYFNDVILKIKRSPEKKNLTKIFSTWY